MPEFKHVMVVSDNIRGHYHQSLGIAIWISKLGNVKLEDPLKLPKIKGIKKFITLKILARKLPSASPNYAKKWLKKFGITVGRYESDTLFISAGSSAAPFCLALAKATGNKAAVIMTPSVLGTKPFDYAIVPEHDKHDANDPKILTTLGAPNHIYVDETRITSERFFSEKNFNEKVAALLIGGSDANYKPNAKWASDILAPIRYIDNTTVLITTSRRSGDELENKIEELFADSPSTGYMLLLSRNPSVNAVTAFLGAATHVCVTEDSVSMVSEAVTAGFKVGLIRVPKKIGFLKKLFGGGTKKFDEMFDKMIMKGLIEDLGDVPNFEKFLNSPTRKHNKDFNEAKRAAEWILKS